MKPSIAIPVHSAEPHPDECLNPALDQTYSDAEVIAVDDGPAGSTPEILNGYAYRIRVLGNPNGGTASSALNRGHRQMQGGRSKRLGAGDLPEPRAVETPLVVHCTSLGPASDRRTSCADCDGIDERGNPPAPDRLSRKRDCNGLLQFERSAILPDRFCGGRAAGMSCRAALGRCGPSGGAPGLDEGCELRPRPRPPHGRTLRFVPGAAARWRSLAVRRTTSPRRAGLRRGGGGGGGSALRTPPSPPLRADSGGCMRPQQHRRTRRRPS